MRVEEQGRCRGRSQARVAPEQRGDSLEVGLRHEQHGREWGAAWWWQELLTSGAAHLGCQGPPIWPRREACGLRDGHGWGPHSTPCGPRGTQGHHKRSCSRSTNRLIPYLQPRGGVSGSLSRAGFSRGRS